MMLLDRSGQGKVYPLITRRRFQQLDVLEGLNLVVTISGLPVSLVIVRFNIFCCQVKKINFVSTTWVGCEIRYFTMTLRWKRNLDMRLLVTWKVVPNTKWSSKLMTNHWHWLHVAICRYERIKFLVIALRNNIEVYAWAPRPYHKFMAFKSFSDLPHKPLIVDLTVEEGSRLKVSLIDGWVSINSFFNKSSHMFEWKISVKSRFVSVLEACGDRKIAFRCSHKRLTTNKFNIYSYYMDQLSVSMQ